MELALCRSTGCKREKPGNNESSTNKDHEAAQLYTIHASRVTHHDSRITIHASRITHHASRITHHDSRITIHENHFVQISTTPHVPFNDWYCGGAVTDRG